MKNKNKIPLEDVPKDPDDEELNYRTEESYSFKGSEFPEPKNTKICPTCNAADENCPTCDGEGEIPNDEDDNSFMFDSFEEEE